MIVQAQYTETPGMPEWSKNPLVSALGQFRDAERLLADLYQNPYEEIRLRLPPAHIADSLLDRLTTDAFAVGIAELEFAKVTQQMLWTGLARRDPLRAAVMQAIYSLSNSRGQHIDKIPWSSAWADSGMVPESTGQGKSHLLQRSLALWPQAIRHGKIENVWNAWLQLTYLNLDLTYDGNLRGLLLHILNAIDRAFDYQTDYANSIPKKSKNISDLQVWVIDALKRHFCGLLALDELQTISLLMGRDAKLVTNFFLRLLNQGIPMILMGNPFAFIPFRRNSQVTDRLTSVRFPQLTPTGFADECSRDFLSQLWQMQIMPKIPPLDDALRVALFECSAWHRRHVVRAMKNGQRYALAKDAQQLTPQHIISGFNTYVEAKTKTRIQAFVEKNPIPLLEWDDIPVLSFAKQWGVEDETFINMATAHDRAIANSNKAPPVGTQKTPESTEPGTTTEPSAKKNRITVKSHLVKERKKVKARQTREEKKRNEDSADVTLATDPDDLRARGLKASLVESFNSLPSATPSNRPSTLNSESPPPKKKRKQK